MLLCSEFLHIFLDVYLWGVLFLTRLFRALVTRESRSDAIHEVFVCFREGHEVLGLYGIFPWFFRLLLLQAQNAYITNLYSCNDYHVLYGDEKCENCSAAVDLLFLRFIRRTLHEASIHRLPLAKSFLDRLGVVQHCAAERTHRVHREVSSSETIFWCGWRIEVKRVSRV